MFKFANVAVALAVAMVMTQSVAAESFGIPAMGDDGGCGNFVVDLDDLSQPKTLMRFNEARTLYIRIEQIRPESSLRKLKLVFFRSDVGQIRPLAEVPLSVEMMVGVPADKQQWLRLDIPKAAVYSMYLEKRLSATQKGGRALVTFCAKKPV